jgi:hypothetical protein
VSIVEGDCEFSAIATSPVTYSVASPWGIDGWPIDLIVHVAVDADQQSAGTLETALEAIESDIKTAMLVDPLRGNSDFVRDTYYVGASGPVNLGNNIGAIRMTFAVKYDFLPSAP